jgi:pilus assembly protein CpaC
VGNAALVTLQEQSYGVKLTFLPTVLKNDVINLQVSPEVSDLSNTGVQFQYGDGKIQPMPAIDVRSASTTVQLRDGQSFAIGGLLKDSMRGKLDAFPGLGEIPVLGALFRSTSYQSEKTELVFIVTPHLVKPLDGATTLPTDTFGNTSQLKVLATGNMEGDAPSPNAQAAPPAAPAMLSPPVPRAGAGKAKPVQGEVP